jgi:hypothetical protein
MTEEKRAGAQDREWENRVPLASTPEEELLAAKGLLVSMLQLVGGRVLIPNSILEMYTGSGELRTNLTDEGMLLEYIQNPGGVEPEDIEDAEDEKEQKEG